VSRGTARFPSTGARVREATGQAVASRNANIAIASTVTETKKIRTLMANMDRHPLR
jgi:hypothetical protein